PAKKHWLSIEAGLLLRAHGLRYPTRSLMPGFFRRYVSVPQYGDMMTEWTLSERNLPDSMVNCDLHRHTDI
ncbi:hypothetical protein B6333_21605, partial [Salmonella enterica subsp. enterica serovar Enteritidis]|nr:hypothetical protein [Salmonella enterica]EBG7230870.1 hypothetical protein [Salmonella enterica subsp. enterica serovar Enteritidis]ECH1577039.1 hypothetical protein [Salmonella enterica subsp. enterica serovar Braenderup]EAY9193817.1 hypothetical protein [Salmonella enterica]EAZ3868264.1 hypothetical protein [Salmonella enterica]